MNYLLIYNTKYTIVNNTQDVLNIITSDLNKSKIFSILMNDSFAFDSKIKIVYFKYNYDNVDYLKPIRTYIGDIIVTSFSNDIRDNTFTFPINYNILTLDILQEVFDRCDIFKQNEYLLK